MCRRSRGAKEPWCSHYSAICREWVAKRSRTTRNGVRNCSSKPDLGAKAKKRRFLKQFVKGIRKRKITGVKIEKMCWQITISQPWCSDTNAFNDVQLQETIVLRRQPPHQATFTQPLECDLQPPSCKTQKNYAQRRQKLQLQNRILAPKQKKTIVKLFLKRNLRAKSPAPKLRKPVGKSLLQPGCSHSTTICDVQLQKT